MNTQVYEEIPRAMKTLKLASMSRELDECLRVADAKGLSHIEFLRTLLRSELRGRDTSNKLRRLSHAHFPAQKTIEEFDFAFQKSIKKPRLVNLSECRWLENATNLLFTGPPGVGKTHLSIALGQKAIEKGYRVRFFQAEDLLQKMYVSAAAGQMERYLKSILKNDVIILDEFAYLPLDAHAGNYLYRLVNSAYETTSLVITSNKEIETWGEMFQDQAIAQAILDRFLHHCEVFKLNGDSYRLKDARESHKSSGKKQEKKG